MYFCNRKHFFLFNFNIKLSKKNVAHPKLINRQGCVIVQSREMKLKHLSLQRVHIQNYIGR